MRDLISALIAGLLFGIGLCLSGMTDPSVVIGFLDVAGAWNPQLLLVMAAGVPVTFIGYRLAFRRAQPLFSDVFSLPTKKDIDTRLLGGAALFGVGWGLSGYCPGPVTASLAGGNNDVLIFVAAMLIGMLVVRLRA
jgi:uncharacterized membrane protein YedE/YeeE